jgi:hypothetical protein
MDTLFTFTSLGKTIGLDADLTQGSFSENEMPISMLPTT